MGLVWLRVLFSFWELVMSSKSQKLSTVARSCARFTEVVHVSHAPPKNVRVQLLWNGRLSLGALNQTIPICIYIYIYIICIYIYTHNMYIYICLYICIPFMSIYSMLFSFFGRMAHTGHDLFNPSLQTFSSHLTSQQKSLGFRCCGDVATHRTSEMICPKGNLGSSRDSWNFDCCHAVNSTALCIFKKVS